MGHRSVEEPGHFKCLRLNRIKNVYYCVYFARRITLVQRNQTGVVAWKQSLFMRVYIYICKLGSIIRNVQYKIEYCFLNMSFAFVPFVFRLRP